MENMADLIRNMRRVQQQREAAQVTQDHIIQGRPLPIAGSKIRCVHSIGETTFEQDTIVFEEGRVYEVVYVGLKAFDHHNNVFEPTASPEAVAEARANMAERIERLPGSEGGVAWVRDPVSGEEQSVTFPAFPGVVFMLVDNDAVDVAQEKAIPDGSTISFTEFTIIGDVFPLTLNKPYTVNNGRLACECDNPECKGRLHTIYDVVLDDGETRQFSFPYNFAGVAAVFPATH